MAWGSGLALFVLFFIVGVGVSRNSWNGYVYVYVADQRSPSAIPRRHDLTRFVGPELTKRIHERLVGDARIQYRDGGLGIELGQFVTENKRQQKVFACAVYDTIQMRFVAEGVATSGKLPVMDVEGRCEVNTDQIKWIKPIWIPIKTVVGEAPANKQISFYDDEPVSLRFSNMSDYWPSQWVLDSVQLTSSDGKIEVVTIDRDRIRMAAPKSIILEWQDQK